MVIDIERCLKALDDIAIKGDPSPSNRQQLIEEAIKLIQKDGGKQLDYEDIFSKANVESMVQSQ